MIDFSSTVSTLADVIYELALECLLGDYFLPQDSVRQLNSFLHDA